MADAWDQFSDAPAADPWGQFKDARTKPVSQTLGLIKGVMKPVDNASMAVEAGLGKLGVPTGAINRALGMPSAAQATDTRAQAIAADPSRPGKWGEFAGNVVGTIPTSMVTKNPWIGGALAGAALTDKRDLGGVLMDAGIGAVAGKVADKVVGGIAQAVKPVFSPSVARLKAQGFRLSPGQIAGGRAMVREDKAMSRPFVGDAIAATRRQGLDHLPIATANRALQPLGVTVPKGVEPGFESMTFAHEAVDKAYNAVIPKLTLATNRATLAKGANIPASQAKEFNRIIGMTVGSGKLAGREVKNAEGELRRLATSYIKSPNPAEKELGFALGRAHDRLMATMVAQNPVAGPTLKAVNRAFRGKAVLEDATSRAAVDGFYSPAQLGQAVKRADGTARKGATARGAAFMQDLSNDARKVLPSKYPDSGTAGRQAGLVAGARGLVDLGAYRGRQGVQAVLDAPRPAVADPIAAMLLKRRNMLALGGPAALGLLSE
jgi:hypothetical protein